MHVIKWLMEHRNNVSIKLSSLGNDLAIRGRRHDNSYTDDTESELFIQIMNAETQEQKDHFKELLNSVHGKVNDYYPSYFEEDGTRGMHILQLLEYICDKMATYEKTHIKVSAMPTQEYYDYVLEDLGDISDDLIIIIKNTMDYIYNKNMVIHRMMKQEENYNYEQTEG
jgi:hypothetical protein